MAKQKAKDPIRTPKKRLTGQQKIKNRKILKDNPIYYDKILRDNFGPPPAKSKVPRKGPVLRDKDGKVIRALLSQGGEVSMPLYQSTVKGFLRANDGGSGKRRR
jgi:hypothetical protein